MKSDKAKATKDDEGDYYYYDEHEEEYYDEDNYYYNNNENLEDTENYTYYSCITSGELDWIELDINFFF